MQHFCIHTMSPNLCGNIVNFDVCRYFAETLSSTHKILKTLLCPNALVLVLPCTRECEDGRAQTGKLIGFNIVLISLIGQEELIGQEKNIINCR